MNGPTKGIKGISELSDFRVEDSNGIPKGGVGAVPIDSLLIGFIGRSVGSQKDMCSAQKIPGEGIRGVFMDNCL